MTATTLMLRICFATMGLVALVLPASSRLAHAADRSALRTQLVQDGSARVIVELAAPAVPEGRLAGAAAIASQRATIARAQSELMDALPSAGWRATARFSTIPFIALEVDAEALDAIERSGFVRGIEEDRVFFPALTESPGIIEAPEAWGAGFDGTGQVVVIVDTGVDGGHPFLTGKLVSEACYTAVTLCPNGLTEQVGPGAAAPCFFGANGCDHGTHVAGISAGREGLLDGRPIAGVAHGANIVAMQIFDMAITGCEPDTPIPCPQTSSSSVIRALERVDELRESLDIAVVNMSLTAGGFTTQAECDELDSAVKQAIENLRSQGIAVVAASGNDGFTDAIGTPACLSPAISVGATDKADQVADFSNSAPFLSLLAPGVAIESSVPDGQFTILDGTSMAAPHVAGAWAILKQSTPGASVDDVLAALRSTGVPVLDPKSGNSTPRIRVHAALEALTGCGQWSFVSTVTLPADFFQTPAPPAAARGTQVTPDLEQTLVSKDVQDQRWAVSRNESDNTVTGNVFTSADVPPQFVFCSPGAGGGLDCSGTTACSFGNRGVVQTPDGERTLVNKDVGGERWAIARNETLGTITGNVFTPGVAQPQFVFCTPLGGDSYRCHGADPCTSGTCAAQWTFLADVTLPCSFFGDDCGPP
jgi:subtilisin family serine protease